MRSQFWSVSTDPEPPWIRFSLPEQLLVHPPIDPFWGASRHGLLCQPNRGKQIIYWICLWLSERQWALLLETESELPGQPQRSTGQSGWRRQRRQAGTEIFKDPPSSLGGGEPRHREAQLYVQGHLAVQRKTLKWKEETQSCRAPLAF